MLLNFFYQKAMPKPPNPYHVMPPATVHPTSAQDSEIASHSSGAHTDDLPPIRREWRHIKRNAEENKNVNDLPMIPRTQREVPPNQVISHIAQEDPEGFAQILIEKLNQVKINQELEEELEDEYKSKEDAKRFSKIYSALLKLQMETKKKDESTQSLNHNINCANSNNSRPYAANRPHLSRFWEAVGQMQDKNSVCDENDQEILDQQILDQHCSRVFQETPTSRTPGHATPPHLIASNHLLSSKSHAVAPKLANQYNLSSKQLPVRRSSKTETFVSRNVGSEPAKERVMNWMDGNSGKYPTTNGEGASSDKGSSTRHRKSTQSTHSGSSKKKSKHVLWL